MANLLVTYAHPNPAGKDRTSSGAPNNQLNAEWVEFCNTTNQDLPLSGLALIHQTYNQSCQKIGSDVLLTFNGTLGGGRSIRVHTGSGQPAWEGTVFHMFLNRGNYVWNNRCGDSVMLQSGNTLIDWADYGANPPEGRTLTRVAGRNWLA